MTFSQFDRFSTLTLIPDASSLLLKQDHTSRSSRSPSRLYIISILKRALSSFFSFLFFFVHTACAPTFNFLQQFFYQPLSAITLSSAGAVKSPRPRETEGCTMWLCKYMEKDKNKTKITLGVKDPLSFFNLFDRPSPHTSS